MKRIKALLLLVAIITLSVVSAEAQFIKWGLTAGTYNSFYSVDDDEYGELVTDNYGGFNIGATLTFAIPLVSITPEVIYTQSQFNIDKELLTSNCIVTVRSIDIPVIAAINILGPIKLEAGPRFSIYNKAKGEFYGEKIDMGRTRSQLGYVVGLKAVILKKFTVGARYNGQFDKYSTSLNRDVNSFDMKYQSVTANVGFLF